MAAKPLAPEIPVTAPGIMWMYASPFALVVRLVRNPPEIKLAF
jgi:hypothetical protein